MDIDTVMNPRAPVRILWGFLRLNGHAINVVVDDDVCISPNRIEFLICFTGIVEFSMHYNYSTHITPSSGLDLGLGISVDFRVVRIPWRFPQVFRWVWDENVDCWKLKSNLHGSPGATFSKLLRKNLGQNSYLIDDLGKTAILKTS